jgi:Rrf2 family nitric oxide-sensitive transcriptional repressor
MDRYLEVLDGVTLADLVAPAPGARGGQRVRLVPGLPRLLEQAARRSQVSGGGKSR